ncbi:MAG: ABC transporter ATP-binding protein [Saprospiraceae bacterium]
MISVSQLSKYYSAKPPVVALDNINLEIEEGELFGLIGPDGAGKTTLFRILTTLMVPDLGKATVMGWDVVNDYDKIRKHIGYMPGRFSLYQDLSVIENLEFYATLFNTTIEENYHLIKPIYEQIAPFKDRRAGALSGGMKQKLALSCALIHKPKVLFLDEPTTGVDVVSRKEFWQMLEGLKKEGITILVSTPYMDEASMCDRIALIHEGKILQVAPPHQIAASSSANLWEVRSEKIYTALQLLDGYEGIQGVFPFGDCLHVQLTDPTVDGTFIAAWLQRAGLIDATVKQIQPGIEDVFLMQLSSSQKHQAS